MVKEVLIDLTPIKNTNTGLGQVAKSFAEGMADDEDLRFNFLVSTQPAVGVSRGANFTVAREWQRICPLLLPKVDLWHSTFQQYRLLRLTRKTRHVLTVHDLNFLYEKTQRKAKQYLQNLQHRIDKADVVVAISNFVADDIRKNIDLKNTPLKVIYNAVPRLDDQPDMQPGFIRASKRPFFFALGQILQKKNFHVLLDVMKQFPDTDLYICGRSEGGDYGRYIDNRISSESIDNVFLVGAINDQEKNWMYRHCEAFLFPSKFEGFGLPIIEAMQFGKPVFCSSMTSLPEIAGGYAFIWENFDADSMVRLIRNNLSDFSSDQQRVERAKAHAHSFSLTRHNEEYLRLYREVLS